MPHFSSLLDSRTGSWMPVIRQAVEEETNWGYIPWNLKSCHGVLEYIEMSTGIDLGAPIDDPRNRMILSRARAYWKLLSLENTCA